MQEWKIQLDEAFDDVRSKVDFEPEVAIILGSGLGNFADNIKVEKTLSYNDVKHMPHSTVQGHKGQFVFGYIGKTRVVAMQGRVHLYEGYSAQQVVLPVRLMAKMGAKYLIVTNAAGGIAYTQVGTLMLITDHISSFVPSPLIGENFDEIGERFPDMSHAYSYRLSSLACDVADQMGIELGRGVYIQFTGPQFETPAEIRMADRLGADAVGMSTAIEVIAANHIGMEVLGISCITNPACGLSNESLSHVDVQKAADIAGENLSKLICSVVERIKE